MKFERSSLKDFVFPPSCQVCDTQIFSSSPALCSNCQPENICVETSSTCCSACNEPQLEQAICQICNLYPLPFGTVLSMWEYNFQVEQLISAIKYKGKFSLISWVAKLSAQFLESREKFTSSWDIILPVPSKTANSQDRGYNPVALFVRKLGKHLSIPTATTALIISDSSPNRARLSIAERSQSPSPVISLNKRFKRLEELLKNKKVLLVDDVLTTGATASAAASVLPVCSRVDLFTIARSSRFTANRLSIEHRKQFRNDVFQEIA